MPEIDEIKRGREIGYKHPYLRYIWHACIDCGKERWVALKKDNPQNTRCPQCGQRTSGDKRRGPHGTVSRGKGYVAIKLLPSDFFFPMADIHGYVMIHRLMVAKRLGRCLLPQEKVHHKDGIRSHNEDSNLELISRANHALLNSLCADCEVRKEIRLLRWQVKELTSALQEKLKV